MKQDCFYLKHGMSTCLWVPEVEPAAQGSAQHCQARRSFSMMAWWEIHFRSGYFDGGWSAPSSYWGFVARARACVCVCLRWHQQMLLEAEGSECWHSWDAAGSHVCCIQPLTGIAIANGLAEMWPNTRDADLGCLNWTAHQPTHLPAFFGIFVFLKAKFYTFVRVFLSKSFQVCLER